MGEAGNDGQKQAAPDRIVRHQHVDHGDDADEHRPRSDTVHTTRDSA